MQVLKSCIGSVLYECTETTQVKGISWDLQYSNHQMLPCEIRANSLDFREVTGAIITIMRKRYKYIINIVVAVTDPGLRDAQGCIRIPYQGGCCAT